MIVPEQARLLGYEERNRRGGGGRLRYNINV